MNDFSHVRTFGEKLWHWLCYSEDILRIVAILGMTILVFISIMLRLILCWASPAWDEIARYIMIWSIMAGAIVTSREDEHIKMGFLKTILRSERQQLTHEFITTVVTLLFLIFFTVWSYQYLTFSVERNLRSIVTNIPMAPVHASFLIGVSLSLLHFFIHTIRKGMNLSTYLRRKT